jgi:D-glycero-D-manno-heptose 1,7-bisphosphate phosphatase
VAGASLGGAAQEPRALFLDRDGVINIDRGYVHRSEDFHFREGIFELCRAAQRLEYLLMVVTNQAGIARGYFTEANFLELTDWMVGKFAEEQVRISRVYYCPFHPVDGIGIYKFDSPDRKPNPGMLLRAQKDFDLNLASSALIGDRLSDVQAAHAAGVGTRILLGSRGVEAERCTAQYQAFDSLYDIRHAFFSCEASRSETTRP